MASFLLTEADEEQIPKPGRIKPPLELVDTDEEENDDQPTQSDNEFIDDGPENEGGDGDDANQLSPLEEMERKLEEKKKNVPKKRGRPPTNKLTLTKKDITNVFHFEKEELIDLLIFTVKTSTQKDENSRYCDTTSTTTCC